MRTARIAAVVLMMAAAVALAADAPRKVTDWQPERWHGTFDANAHAGPYVQARSHTLYDWPFIDGQWLGICRDADGMVWFSFTCHSGTNGAQVFRYDPAGDEVRHVCDVTQACGEKLADCSPQGKVHSAMHADGEWIYCGTAAAHSSHLRPYRGGYYLKINRRTGQVVNLGKSKTDDCLIVMDYDYKHKLLYAHTNTKGILTQFAPATGVETILGVPEANSPAKVKRGLSVMIDPAGNVYGCRAPACTFWQWNRATGAIRDLDVKLPLPAAVAAGDERATKAYNETEQGRIRAVIWSDSEKCFYSIRAIDGMVFRFFPPSDGKAARVQTIGTIDLPGEKTVWQSCMFAIVGRTLWTTPYTGWGGEVRLVSMDLDSGKSTIHGPVVTEDGRIVNECHSIVADEAGKLYLAAFVFSKPATRDPANPWGCRGGKPFHSRLVIVDTKRDLRPGK